MAEINEIGKILDGRYKITRRLAQGAFGQTFLAEDLKRPNNPVCVVKKLQPKQSHPDFLAKAIELFDREAKALELLGEHPQIPRLLAHLEIEKEFYLVEEYIAGETLKEEFNSQNNAEQQVIELTHELLNIVAFLQENNIIHRDIKPSNIIRRETDRKLVLIDFGAVTVFNGETLFGTVLITPGYASPERYQGESGFYSDIYAIGIVAIQALTGVNPCLLEQNKNGEIILPNEVEVSQDFKTILTKMVRASKGDRYRDAKEVIRDLDFLGSTVPSTLINPKPNNKMNSIPKKLLISGFAVLVALPLGWWRVGMFETASNSNLPLNGKAIYAELNAEKPCLDVLLEQDIYCQKYSLIGAKNSQITLEMNSDDFDPMLVLQQPNGEKLDLNSDRSTKNWNAQIKAQLPSDGEYTVIVRTTSPEESGRYTIRARFDR